MTEQLGIAKNAPVFITTLKEAMPQSNNFFRKKIKHTKKKKENAITGT